MIPVWLTPLFLSLVALTPVIASNSQQPARRDSAWGDLSDPLWQQFVDSVIVPAAGIAGDTWRDLWDEFVEPDTPSKSPPEVQPLDPIPGDQTEWANPSEQGRPQFPANSPLIAPQTPATDGHECDSPPVGAPDARNQCGIALRKIIYALDCADGSQNAAIEGILARTVQPGTKTSRTVDDDCGVICWTGELTEEGAEKMRRTGGVLAVVPDVIAREDYTSTPYVPSQKRDESSHPGLLQERKQIVKRDTIVRLEGLTTVDLSFISTPEGTLADDCDYVYYSAAGEGTFVYVIDIGVEPSNSEFSLGVIKRWLYAWDAHPSEKEVVFSSGNGHGSCAASKVAGRATGVAKKTSLIIVKTTSSLSSFVDAMTEVLNDLRHRTIAGEYKPGYNIVTVQQGYQGPAEIDQWSMSKLTRQILKLISAYGIVFVCSAGNNGLGAGTVGFPASLSPKVPIIAVGSTNEDGIQLADSSRGPQVTVSAPGHVLCAGNQPGPNYQIFSGTSFAAPAVAGLAAYFLSLHDVGPMLRNMPTELIPAAVKDYIVKAAYVRPGSTVLSVWNLLNGART